MDTLVEHFEEDLKLCWDKHATLLEERIVPTRQFPWYTEEIKLQKQKVR